MCQDWTLQLDFAKLPEALPIAEGGSIRPMQAADVDFLEVCHCREIAGTRGAFEEHCDATWLVGVHYGQQVAFVAYHREKDAGEIDWLFVLPAYRRMGWGRRMLETALKALREESMPTVIMTAPDDVALCCLSAKLGFACADKDWARYGTGDMAPEKPTPIALWPQGAPGFREDYGQVPTITPFLLPGTHGAVIVCPGGGYAMKAAHEGAPIARRLNQMGISAFVLDYRVKPYAHPVPLLDAQRAIRMVRYHAVKWGILPDKIAILGFSAGGHLTGTAGTWYDAGNPDAEDPIDRVSCRPDAFLPCYAVQSFVENVHMGSARNLTGMEEPPEALLRELSIELRVNDDTPPAFFWHTAADAGVPVENSLMMATAMARHKRPFALHVFPNGPHGIGLALGDPLAGRWSGLAGAWLHELGF